MMTDVCVFRVKSVWRLPRFRQKYASGTYNRRAVSAFDNNHMHTGAVRSDNTTTQQWQRKRVRHTCARLLLFVFGEKKRRFFFSSSFLLHGNLMAPTRRVKEHGFCEPRLACFSGFRRGVEIRYNNAFHSICIRRDRPAITVFIYSFIFFTISMGFLTQPNNTSLRRTGGRRIFDTIPIFDNSKIGRLFAFHCPCVLYEYPL